MQCHFPHLAFWKKRSEPLPRPVLGSETPYRRKKAEQEGPEAGAFSVRPASLLEFLVRVKAQQGEMAGDGGSGNRLGHSEASAGISMLRPYHPASYTLCIERKK